MTNLAAISEISDRGISARIEGDEIFLTAPKGTLTPEITANLRSRKADLLRSLKELRKRAGSDWNDISGNPAQLKAFAELAMIEDMRKQGITPDHYTSKTECKHCGPVPIFEGCPPEVDGCPWCFNRIKGLPVPNTFRR